MQAYMAGMSDGAVLHVQCVVVFPKGSQVVEFKHCM